MQCAALIEAAIARFGRLDVLVNNAGRAMWARFDQLADASVIEDLMRVNFLGGVYCTHAVLEHLKQSRGLIVALASISGLTGVPLLSGYAASKHAIIGFFESLRIELAESGVGVTIAAPDFVQSEILERATGKDGLPLDHSPLEQSKLMTAEACARRIVRAMAGRRRLVFTSQRSAFALGETAGAEARRPHLPAGRRGLRFIDAQVPRGNYFLSGIAIGASDRQRLRFPAIGRPLAPPAGLEMPQAARRHAAR